MTNRTEQVSIRRNADGSIEMLSLRGRSRPGTLPAEAEELLFPARYFSTPFEPLPVAYYRQESRDDGEDVLSELNDALADMRIRIAEDMRHAEFKLQDNSETSWDDWEEGLVNIPLVEDNSTGLPNDAESRIQGDELTEDDSTAPSPTEIQNYDPTEEDNAVLVTEEESTVQDKDSEQIEATTLTPMSPRSVHLQRFVDSEESRRLL